MPKTSVRKPKNKAKDGSWTEIRDGMRIDWDLPIAMADGTVLRADVYRPNKKGKFPELFGTIRLLEEDSATTDSED